MRTMLASALCFLVSSAVCFCSMQSALSAPVSAAAADLQHLTPETLRAYENSFRAYYLARDGTYKAANFAYFTAESVYGYTYETPWSDSPALQVAWWRVYPGEDAMPYMDGSGITAVAPMAYIDFNLQFTDITEFRGGWFCYWGYAQNSGYTPATIYNVAPTTVRQYNYMSYAVGGGDIQTCPVPYNADLSLGSPVFPWTNLKYGSGCISYSGSLSSVTIGSVYASNLAVDSGGYSIGLLVPSVSGGSIVPGVSPGDDPGSGGDTIPGVVQGTGSASVSGSITPGTDGVADDVNLTVDLDVPMPDIGPIQDAAQDIAEGVLGGEDPAPPELIAEPPEDIDFDTALEDADAILDDVPDVTAASGFWFALWNKFFVEQDGSTNPMVIMVVLFPVAILLNLVSQVLWKR